MCSVAMLNGFQRAKMFIFDLKADCINRISILSQISPAANTLLRSHYFICQSDMHNKKPQPVSLYPVYNILKEGRFECNIFLIKFRTVECFFSISCSVNKMNRRISFSITWYINWKFEHHWETTFLLRETCLHWFIVASDFNKFERDGFVGERIAKRSIFFFTSAQVIVWVGWWFALVKQ